MMREGEKEIWVGEGDRDVKDREEDKSRRRRA